MTANSIDCVQMKNDIQQRLRREYGHLDWSKRNQKIREEIRQDPHLAKLLQVHETARTRTGHPGATDP